MIWLHPISITQLSYLQSVVLVDIIYMTDGVLFLAQFVLLAPICQIYVYKLDVMVLMQDHMYLVLVKHNKLHVVPEHTAQVEQAHVVIVLLGLFPMLAPQLVRRVLQDNMPTEDFRHHVFYVAREHRPTTVVQHLAKYVLLDVMHPLVLRYVRRVLWDRLHFPIRKVAHSVPLQHTKLCLQPQHV
jgi:hypothetical protein